MTHNRLPALGALIVVAPSLPLYGRTWNHFMHVLGDALIARWNRFGGIATLLPLLAPALMLYKPSF